MIEMRETPDIMIVMPYFKHGNIRQAGIREKSKLVTAFGQILDCLTFLHSRNITHRDIKPDNVLVELEPHFKVVLSDFGLSKAVTETTWLETFCGTIKYLAPEVFPCSLFRYGPPADVWSVGVMALEWLYGIPAAPEKPERATKDVSRDQWRDWSKTWVRILTNRLDDQERSMDVDLLQGMVVVDQRQRLRADRCLEQGFGNGLFRRRTVDGLVSSGTDEGPASTLAGPEDDDLNATVIA
jgi:serine/threonine protein kinase